MSERRAATKGRRLGSSRRRQVREGSGEAPAPAPGPGEEPPWASEIVQRVQDFLTERDAEQAGFVTRSDMQKLQEEGLPCSREELELVFDGLDAAGSGRLGTEEFAAGLRQFLSSQKAAREHRRRKTASRRVRLVLPVPALEGVDSEERRHFAAFMEQLGTDNASEEQEIWQLWVKLRQDEPQLLDNLEDFLAKMRHRIQEARSKKEALEQTLNKRVAEHDKEVQQLCEVLEQQIQQEQRRLQQQSVARSHQHGEELQRVLDASEREVQRLVTAQMELERRCRSLRSSQQVTSAENRELQESNRALEHHLQHLHQQLQQTQGHLRTMRATVAWEHTGEPGDRVVAEVPIEMPMSPQLSPGKSEKFRSEMRIRLGSQSGEGKPKGTHQVVWEMLPAETSLSGAPQRASSVGEDPFPESLKEERFSDQSSLLREMNDAIAALSQHLKAQGPGAATDLADTACHPQDDAEPQIGPEAATAHGTTPEVLQEALPGHVHHELFERDLKEGPATAELRALDVTQTGASTGARHHTAQEPGAEQGQSPEEAQRMLFLQGKGAGVEEMVLNVTEHLGESTEAGEGVGWMQEKTDWEKPQLLGEAEVGEKSQGENLEAGLGPPEAGQEGVAEGQCLAMEELQPAGIPGERVQAQDTALQEWADPSSGVPEKLETEVGEHLEPEPPSWGEAQGGAAHGDGVPEVAAAPGPGVLEEERGVQPRGETMDTEVLGVLPARAGSSRGRGEEEEVEEAEPREAEQQLLQGERAGGGAGRGGGTGAVPPTHGQEGGVGTVVELLEAQSSDTNVELLAEVEADLQVWSEAGSPGTEQGGGVDPGVQLEEENPELGLGEEMGTAAVHSEGPAPAGTPVGSPHLCGLFPVKSQALELVEAEDAQADMQMSGGLSPETLWGGKGGTAIQPEEDEEDGAQEQGEHRLSHEPGPHPSGMILGQGEGTGAGLQPGEEAGSLDTLGDQSTGANVQLIAERNELKLTPGGSTEADLQHLGEAGSTGTEQGGGLDSDVQLLHQVDKAELGEMEAGDSQADMQMSGGLGPGVLWGGESGTDVQIEEEEDERRGRGECELPQEPVLDPQGAAVGQGEGADEDMQAQEEAESLDTTEDQSTGANVQLTAEGNELQVTPAGSTEADQQLWDEAGSPGTVQGGSVAPDVQPLDQVDKEDVLEMEAEDAQEDVMLQGDISPGAPWGVEGGTDLQNKEEEDGAKGQGECELPHEPVLDPQGSGVGQGERMAVRVQPGEETGSLDTTEHQSTGANVQLIAEEGELRLTPGGSTESGQQLLGEAGSPWTEQGGRLDSDAQLLHQMDKAEFMEMEAEDAQTDMQLLGGLSPAVVWGGERGTDVQIEAEEDGRQGQGECELPQEPVLDPQGSGVTPGEEADEDMQAQEEAESLDTTEGQSTGANVQLTAEGNELQVTPGGSTEADLQLWGEAGSPGTEQGGRLDSNVHSLDQVDKAEFLEMEVEDAQTDMQMSGGLSPGVLWRGESGTDVQIEEEEEEDGAQGQGECELPQEPVLDPQGSAVGQGEGADEGMQTQEETESLDTTEAQSTGANVQLIAEGNELQVTPAGSTEADLQLWGEAGSPGIEQGGSVAPDVQPLDQVDKEDVLEMEAEDAQEDTIFHEGLSSGASWRGEGGTDVPIEEEEDGAQRQGECELPHEPGLDPQGSGVGQGERMAVRVQPGEEAESLDSIEDQSTGANVQLIAEEGELRLTLGGSTEADLQLLGEAGSPGTEQGGRLDSNVHSLHQGSNEEFLEMGVEDAQTDMQMSGGLSPGVLWRGESGTDVQIEEDEEDGAQEQAEHGLPHEPGLHPNGMTLGQGEVAAAGLQPGEEAGSLDSIEDQSTGANVQLIAEGNELRLTPGGSTEADQQLLGEAGSPGTEQGGRLDSNVHSLDQVDKAEFLEMEVEDAQADMQMSGGLSPETLCEGESGTDVQIEEEDDGAQGQDECELPQEPVLDPQGEGAGEDMQAQEEAESLDTTEDQSTGANVQLIAEGNELQVTPAGSTEADQQLWDEAGSPGIEQGGSVAPDVQPLDQVDKEDVLEMEAEDAQEDTIFHKGLSSVASWRGEGGTDVPIEEKEEGAQGQGECELPHEPGLDPQGSGVGQGERMAVRVQPGEEAESLDSIEDQSTGANVQLIAEEGELRLTPGGSTEADLQLLGEAGSPGTEQGGRLDSNVHSLDQVDKAEFLEMEVEKAQADMQMSGGLSPGVLWRGESGTDVQIEEEEEEDGAQGQGECELPQEPVLDPQGAAVGQGDEDMQAQEETESLDTTEDQSTGANVQLIAERNELQVIPAGSTEADQQLWGEAGSPGTEQGGGLDSDAQLLDQVDKAELMETEAGDAQTDMQMSGGLSPEVLWRGESGTDVQIEDEEDGAQEQGEHGLPHEPGLHPTGVTLGQGEVAGAGLQPGEEAGGLDTIEDQSTGANVQLIAEEGELRLTLGGSTEADQQLLGEARSPWTEQGGRLDSNVNSLYQVNKEEFLEMEVEDAQADMQMCGGLSPETLWGGESGTDVQIEEEKDGAQGQGECELPNKSMLDPQVSGVGQREGMGAGVQLWEEDESLDTTEDQSTGADVQLLTEGAESKSASGESTEADLQLLSEADSLGSEQGGSVAPDVNPLDQVDKAELVEMETEHSWTGTQLCGGASPELPQGDGDRAAVQLRNEAEDGRQGQGECGLEQELVPHPSGVTIRKRRGTGADVQPVEEVVILDTGEHQSTGANVQLIAEEGELRLTPGGSTEADLQLLGEAGSTGTEQGGSVDTGVQLLDQVDKAGFLEMEAEDAQADLQLCGGLSPRAPWRGEEERTVQIEEEEDGAQGQGERELPHEPVLDPQGAAVRQREGAGEDMQAQEEAESLDTVEGQSTGANVQLTAEGNELKPIPGGSTEADLHLWGEAGSPGTEQGGSVESDAQLLDQVDKAELGEMEVEDAQTDLQLCGGLSPGAPWAGEGGTAIQIEEEEEDGRQGQGECELPQEPVLDPQGAGVRQGEGAGAGLQPGEEAESLDTTEAQSTDADVQLFTEQQEPKSGSGGSMGADLTPLSAAGMWEGEQNLAPHSETGLGAAPTSDMWEGAAAAHVSPPAEAALYPEPVTAAEGSGLEAKPGARIDPEGQIMEDTQALELPQGERAAAEGKPLDGAHGLEVAQGEGLEAGARNAVRTQDLGLNQGHDDAATEASLVSEVLLQIGTLKLETMMQGDVLIPDVWRLCAPGQAAQRELQEQVSAQGHEGRPHTAAQQPEGQTPHAMGPEQAAAGPAEPPKQEVPPASTLHTMLRPGDAGNDQLGVVLGDNSLGQRQLLGEQSKDLGVGQREKNKELGQKMSQEGETRLGVSEAVTAGGAGAAPRRCPKAPLDPDHLYNVLFVGDSHVGKTSFLYRLHADTFNPNLTATVGLDYQIKNLVVDNKRFALRLWDSAGQERYHSMTKQFFRKADGVVLMYDITSEYSFSDVRYWLSCIQEAAEDGVAILLLGNKTDCAAERQVPTKEGERLAKEHQLMFYECSAASGHNVLESMVSFVRLLKAREDELKNKAAEVPQAPQKKKGCCW